MTSVYIKIDNDNNIIDIDSDFILNDLTGWIKIDEGYGDKYGHAQQHYLDKPLTYYGKYNYKYINGEIVEIDNPPYPVISYAQLVENKIRERYTVSDELAILRQRDEKVDEFNDYYAYCELCKSNARQELGIN